MARHESDREDLLAEARNLVERVSLVLRGETEELVAGFRRDGSLAIFFTPQRVYQFTSQGALRRAFVDDTLYKAQRGRLVAMRRDRVAEAVHLVSHELTAEAEREFLHAMRQHVGTLQQGLQAGAFTQLGRVPPVADVAERLLTWLKNFAATITVAQSPRSQ